MKPTEYTITSPSDRIEILKVIEELPEDERWTVKVSKFSGAKTAAQNRLMWKWNTEIGAHYGYTPEEMHEYFKGRYLINIKLQMCGSFGVLVEAVNLFEKGTEKYEKAAKALAAEITTRNLKSEPMSAYLSRLKTFALHEGVPITIPRQEEEEWLLGIRRNKPKVTEI